MLHGNYPYAEHLHERHRWLNNDQAAADSANFMKHVNFEGIDEDLTAPRTPWIYYGVRFNPTQASSHLRTDELGQGSYAGARAAHMRILYPDLVFGAIASSGRCLLLNRLSHHSASHSCNSRYSFQLGVLRSHPQSCKSHVFHPD